MPKTNTGKKYKDRHNDKRRIVYWLDHNNMGWIAGLVRKISKDNKGKK